MARRPVTTSAELIADEWPRKKAIGRRSPFFSGLFFAPGYSSNLLPRRDSRRRLVALLYKLGDVIRDGLRDFEF
jgi:hypothetical protein